MKTEDPFITLCRMLKAACTGSPETFMEFVTKLGLKQEPKNETEDQRPN